MSFCQHKKMFYEITYLWGQLVGKSFKLIHQSWLNGFYLTKQVLVIMLGNYLWVEEQAFQIGVDQVWLKVDKTRFSMQVLLTFLLFQWKCIKPVRVDPNRSSTWIYWSTVVWYKKGQFSTAGSCSSHRWGLKKRKVI